MNNSSTLVDYLLSTSDPIAFSTKEKKEILASVEQNLSLSNFDASLSWLILSIKCNKEKTFDTIKRKGLFRYSKYPNNELISLITGRLLDVKEKLGLCEEHSTYLQSIYSFRSVHRIIREKRQTILEGLPKVEIQELLSIVDDAFATHKQCVVEESPDLISFYSKEELADAFSYIFYLNSTFKPRQTVEKIPLVVNDLLIHACHIRQLQNFEVMIDHFNYICKETEEKLLLLPSDSDYEKSIRIAFTREIIESPTEQHLSNIVSQANLLSFDLIAKSLIDTLTPLANEKLNSGFLPINMYALKKIANEPSFFIEEIASLAQHLDDRLINFEQFSKHVINENLNFGDIIRVDRLFKYLYYLQLTSVDLDPDLTTILSFDKNCIFELLLCILDNQSHKANAAFDILVWHKESSQVLDLQYQPIVNDNEMFLLPLSLINGSNLFRNILALQYKLGNKNVFSDGTEDYLTRLLKDNLDEWGFKTHSEIKYSFIDKNSDIDLLAIKDDDIFIFECKHSLKSGSYYELRTVYDNVIKAKQQLDLSREALSNPDFLEMLEKQTNLALKHAKKIHTCIVLSNKIFSGYQGLGHPIRYIHDIINYCTFGNLSGKGNTVDNSSEKLVSFLSESTELLQIFKNASHPVQIIYPPEILFSSYTINLPELELNSEQLYGIKIDLVSLVNNIEPETC